MSRPKRRYWPNNVNVLTSCWEGRAEIWRESLQFISGNTIFDQKGILEFQFCWWNWNFFLCLTIVIVVAEQSITSYMFECFGIFVRPHCLWPSICFALGKYKGWKSLARLGCCTRKSNLKAGRYWPQSKKIAKVWKLFLNYHPTEEQTVPILDAQSHLFNHGCQSHLLIFHQTSFL